MHQKYREATVYGAFLDGRNKYLLFYEAVTDVIANDGTIDDAAAIAAKAEQGARDRARYWQAVTENV